MKKLRPPLPHFNGEKNDPSSSPYHWFGEGVVLFLILFCPRLYSGFGEFWYGKKHHIRYFADHINSHCELPVLPVAGISGRQLFLVLPQGDRKLTHLYVMIIIESKDDLLNSRDHEHVIISTLAVKRLQSIFWRQLTLVFIYITLLVGLYRSFSESLTLQVCSQKRCEWEIFRKIETEGAIDM